MVQTSPKDNIRERERERERDEAEITAESKVEEKNVERNKTWGREEIAKKRSCHEEKLTQLREKLQGNGRRRQRREQCGS